MGKNDIRWGYFINFDKDEIMKLKLKVAVASLVLIAGAAVGVHAQQNPQGDHQADRAKMMEHMQKAMEKRQTQLHDQLKLSPAQEAAWKTFTLAIADTMTPMDHPDMHGLNTPAQMDKMLEMQKARVAKMETHVAALKTFYAALTLNQQKIFDDAHQRMMNSEGMHERMKAAHH